jgi:hypothetical protein
VRGRHSSITTGSVGEALRREKALDFGEYKSCPSTPDSCSAGPAKGNCSRQSWTDLLEFGAFFGVKYSPMEQVKFDPYNLAVQYYFGDLQYWRIPAICIEALERKFDGRFLRRLAGLVNPVASDIRPEEIDSAFREMGVDAPIPRDQARLALAAESARRAISGESNVFNEATHIRIHICEWHEAPPELQPIVDISEQSEHAPSWKWNNLEKQLRNAMAQFLGTRK